MIAIKTIDLTKRFGTKTAVNSINLSIASGELFSLLGVNGAGKTTTIKMLSCLTPPSSGEAYLCDESIRNKLKVKEMIGVSPQETAVASNLSVRENLELISGINGNSRAVSKQQAEETIESFGMEEIAGQWAKTLSGGWQRRLSIAMALISKPRILFLDEPTIGLDVIARRELWKVIEGLKGEITIVLTSHYLAEAEALSDRIGIMKQGELIRTGTVSEIVQEAQTDSFEDAFIALAAEGGIEE